MCCHADDLTCVAALYNFDLLRFYLVCLRTGACIVAVLISFLVCFGQWLLPFICFFVAVRVTYPPLFFAVLICIWCVKFSFIQTVLNWLEHSHFLP